MDPLSLKNARSFAAPSRPRLGELLNLPNTLTLTRIFMVPVFLGLLSHHYYRATLYVFIAAAVTDGLDGTVARWFDAKTELGAFLDPFADKLMLLGAFIVLTIQGDFQAWVLEVIIIRDVVTAFGYFMLSFVTGERVPVRPSLLGKASTCFQLAAAVAALSGLRAAAPEYYEFLVDAMAAVTAASGMHYVYRGLVWLFYREPEMFE